MTSLMRAARVHRFGGPEVIRVESIEAPEPREGEILVRVEAAGVGPWDTWVRSGKSAVPQPLPLTLGSDISGVVAGVGPAVPRFSVGDSVYGVTNKRFTGGNAELAVACVAMMARKPVSLSHLQAACVPVVAVTAWQMLFTHAGAEPQQTVFVQGGAGNVGAYAVQFARRQGLEVLASALDSDVEYVRSLGASEVVDTQSVRMQALQRQLDIVLDTVGGPSQAALFPLLKPGGVLVSSVSPPDAKLAAQFHVRAMFFLVDVNAAALCSLATWFDAGRVIPAAHTTFPLSAIRSAHEVLERPAASRPRGKMVLAMHEDQRRVS